MRKNFFESTLKKNIIANFGGSGFQFILSILFIPLYISVVGIEAWGLLGIFTTLQASFGILDMGLSGTLTREIARLSALREKEQEMRNLVRTLETIYWSIAGFIGIVFVVLSPLIAHYWVKAEQLSPKTIEQAVLIMGLVVLFQMPIGFYSSGLLGLQKQVLLNGINVSMAVLRSVGALLILWIASPTIQAYLLWQVFISVINALVLAFYLWSKMPEPGHKAVFQLQLLKNVWKFTAGMSGISIIAVILTQMDKVILSKLLSLEMFGYYILANTVAMSLGRVFTPFFFSIYPRFTQLVSTNAQKELVQLYHKSCQFISVLVIPIALVIAFFSYEIILLWTQNPIAAEKIHPLVSIMICGSAIQGLMNPAYALQLAYGWTKLSLYKNIVALFILVPLFFYMAINYGVTGASSVWVILHVGLFFFEIPIMHYRLLRTEKWRWYIQDVSLPLIACTAVAGIGRLFLTEPMTPYMLLLYLFIISVLTFGMAVIITPATRGWLFKLWMKNEVALKE